MSTKKKSKQPEKVSKEYKSYEIRWMKIKGGFNAAPFGTSFFPASTPEDAKKAFIQSYNVFGSKYKVESVTELK